jgi:hypothetical protein
MIWAGTRVTPYPNQACITMPVHRELIWTLTLTFLPTSCPFRTFQKSKLVKSFGSFSLQRLPRPKEYPNDVATLGRTTTPVPQGPNIGRKKITSTTNPVRDEMFFPSNLHIPSLTRLGERGVTFLPTSCHSPDTLLPPRVAEQHDSRSF